MLHFIDRAAERFRTGDTSRSKIVDRQTGWKIVLAGAPASAASRRVELLIYPSSGSRAAGQWDSIGRCKTIHFGKIAEAQQIGLPTSLNHLYFASDIGLYLVKP